MGWPASTCQFPDWLKGITWRDLSGQSRYSIAENGGSFLHHKLKTPSSIHQQWSLTSEYQCIHSSKIPGSSGAGNEYAILSLTHHSWLVMLLRLSNKQLKYKVLMQHYATRFYFVPVSIWQ